MDLRWLHPHIKKILVLKTYRTWVIWIFEDLLCFRHLPSNSLTYILNFFCSPFITSYFIFGPESDPPFSVDAASVYNPLVLCRIRSWIYKDRPEFKFTMIPSWIQPISILLILDWLKFILISKGGLVEGTLLERVLKRWRMNCRGIWDLGGQNLTRVNIGWTRVKLSWPAEK